MIEAQALHLWTVYNHPRDHPECCFVARRWEARAGALMPTQDMFTADTLDELRALLPPGLHRLPRQPGDDPVIVEVWI